MKFETASRGSRETEASSSSQKKEDFSTGGNIQSSGACRAWERKFIRASLSPRITVAVDAIETLVEEVFFSGLVGLTGAFSTDAIGDNAFAKAADGKNFLPVLIYAQCVFVLAI